MITFELSEEQTMIRDSLQGFAAEVLAPAPLEGVSEGVVHLLRERLVCLRELSNEVGVQGHRHSAFRLRPRRPG